MLLGSLLLALTGCLGRGPLLSDVTVAPTTISPNADGVEDVAAFHYKVSRPCQLSIYFVGPDGEKRYFRRDRRRSPGEYQALFGGAVEGRVLPDGQYTYVIEATDVERDTTERVEGQITVVGGDTTLPELRDFTVFPQVFTPNQDGINDRVRVNYVLTKPAEVRVWIEDAQGRFVTSILEEEKNPVEPGLPGRHQYDYDAGVDADAPPPPDGTYTVIAEARDEVGNVVRERAPLTIVEGGVPRATIQMAEIGPSVVPLGETVVITAVVKNIGSVPIRTTGPPPGTEYTTRENFNTKGFPRESGAFRLGAEFDANVTGLGYPYRWRLGNEEDLEVRIINGQKHYYLPVGKTVTVTGYIRIVDKPLRRNPYFYVGLFHEDVRKVEGEVAPTQITIEY
ncbi:MAG: hypothetical protein ACE5MB_01815 [Anaerolineae bacterium]